MLHIYPLRVWNQNAVCPRLTLQNSAPCLMIDVPAFRYYIFSHRLAASATCKLLISMFCLPGMAWDVLLGKGRCQNGLEFDSSGFALQNLQLHHIRKARCGLGPVAVGSVDQVFHDPVVCQLHLINNIIHGVHVKGGCGPCILQESHSGFWLVLRGLPHGEETDNVKVMFIP